LFIIFAAADAGPVMPVACSRTAVGDGPRRHFGSARGAVSYVDTATRADWARLPWPGCAGWWCHRWWARLPARLLGADAGWRRSPV